MSFNVPVMCLKCKSVLGASLGGAPDGCVFALFVEPCKICLDRERGILVDAFRLSDAKKTSKCRRKPATGGR